MALRNAFALLAAKLQEAASEGLSHNDLQKWLSDACNDSGCWLVDILGDGDSGDVIYCCNGDMKQAPYEIRAVNGKMTASIDIDAAIDVLPRTTYEPEADEDDHYASMEAAKLYTKGKPILLERAISKAERDAADPGSFAGKGKSFPILKPGDVQAAVHAMGRAGSDNHSTATLKKNIIAIAKKKGFGSQLPKAWQSGDDDSTEAATGMKDCPMCKGSGQIKAGESAVVEITGDVIPLKEGAVGQDGTVALKLIAPGWGSSGYYSPELLERDGPKIFTKGTKNFWDHQTAAEEAARPEGSLRDLASVLTEDAHYEKNGSAGPGLYAKAQVAEQFRKPVDDLAKHIGVSIRASGKAKEGVAPDGKKGRIIEQLTHGTSVDYVTTPGAGGKVLQLFEAARGTQSTSTEGEDMDLKQLQEANRNISKRLAKAEAREVAEAKLKPIRLPEASKVAIIERALADVPITETGDFDKDKFAPLLEAEIQYAASFVPGGAQVVGLGAATGADPKLA